VDHVTLPDRKDGEARLVQSLLSGRISRRAFIQRAAATGMSAAAIGAALSVAGVRAQSPTAAAGGAFDPMRYAGSTVRITLVDGENDEKGLLDKIPEIQETMGITVEVNTQALGALLEQNNQNLTAPESAVDIMHILGFSVAGTAGAGLMTDITDWVADPFRMPADYDFADFPAGQLDYCGFFNVQTGEFGGDTLFMIPGIHSGSCVMFYRPDLLEAAGLEVPTTWEAYLAAAEALNKDGVAGNSMIGANDVSLFLVDWYTRFITMGGQFTTGNKNDKTLNTNLNSPEAVAALQHMIDCVQFAPEAVTTYGFTETVDQFATGNVALMIMWSTIGGRVYGPDSPIKDTVSVAQVPASEGQTARAIRGGWGLGIPANLPQERKDAAYQVLTFITSKEFEKHQVGTYQTDPNRISTGSDSDLVAQLPYLPEAVAAIESAQILEIANIPETFQIVGEISREFNLALAGTKDATTACADAQTASEGILRTGGHLT
jgi:multiple sugar transport system substrate-binding protein